MIPNQLVYLSSTRFNAYEFIATPDSLFMLVWGGSYGHLADLQSISAPLMYFFNQYINVRIEIMGDPQFAVPFPFLLAHKFCFFLLVR